MIYENYLRNYRNLTNYVFETKTKKFKNRFIFRHKLATKTQANNMICRGPFTILIPLKLCLEC